MRELDRYPARANRKVIRQYYEDGRWVAITDDGLVWYWHSADHRWVIGIGVPTDTIPQGQDPRGYEE